MGFVDVPAGVMPGAWRFAALYNGTTYETPFTVNGPPLLTQHVLLPIMRR